MIPRKSWSVFMLLSLLLLIGMVASPAYGADADVTDCSDYAAVGGLGEALIAANTGGGIITFLCSGTITFPAQFIVNASITINSNGNNVIFDGGGTTSFFQVNSPFTLRLNSLTLRNGSGNSGAIFNNGGVVFIDNSILFSNYATDRGGTIRNDGLGMTITDTFIHANIAANGGGAIYNIGPLNLSGVTFLNNTATTGNGGAVLIEGGSFIEIVSGAFLNNTATTGNGGGIHNIIPSSVTLIDLTFTGNSAVAGGGLSHNSLGTLTISNSIFTNNVSTGGLDSGSMIVSAGVTSQNSHYENGACHAFLLPGGDLGGNTAINSPDCPGGLPIPLSVEPLSCVGDDMLVTINAGDGNFDISSFSGGGLPVLDVPAGSYIISGTGEWADVMVSERTGDRETIIIGDVSCPSGVVTPPSDPPASVALSPDPFALGCTLTTNIDVANAGDDTFCRILMQNGGVVNYSGAVPESLIGLGVKLAVDVYRLDGGQSITDFGGYSRVCLSGQGRLFYLDARGAPRGVVELATESLGGATCGWIPAAGTLVLTN